MRMSVVGTHFWYWYLDFENICRLFFYFGVSYFVVCDESVGTGAPKWKWTSGMIWIIGTG
jgi:hypothetical protein